MVEGVIKIFNLLVGDSHSSHITLVSRYRAQQVRLR